MSTVWKESFIPGAEHEPAGTGASATPDVGAFAGASGLLEMDDDQLVETWCGRYGVTRAQLVLATNMVGLMPAALHFYFSSRGRPTKVVTDEMRAARAPIRPRDRRRKDIVPANDAPDAQASGIAQLREERSATELGVRTASQKLHEHLCPSTIRAYDAAQTHLDDTCARLDAAERAAVPVAVEAAARD